MDSKQIEALLARYWNCETSLEEEQQLKEYFKEAGIPSGEFKEEALLFGYFNEQKERSLTDGTFDDRVMTRLNKPVRGRTAKFFHNTMRIAAGIAVVMAAVWFIHSEMNTGSNPSAGIPDTYDDPHKAFEETKKALLMISKSFGTAEEQAKKINLFNEAREQIQGGPAEKTDKKKDLRDS